MSDIILENCKTTDNKLQNIIIKDGKIQKITKTLLTSDKTTDDIIDIKENVIIPGLIDTHVHFRDPGLTYKEDWKTGSMAAAHGGYTTVIDMPNTLPQTDTVQNFLEKKNIAQKKSYVDFALHAGVKSLDDVVTIDKENPASFKIFMDLYDNNQLEKMFSYVSHTNKTLSLHCEDKTLVEFNTKFLKKDPENEYKTFQYSYARSALAELISINRAIELARHFNIKLHICHVTTRQSLELIRMAKDSIDISIEVTPHHLLLDNSTYNTYGVKAKTNPPLRDKNYNITLSDIESFNSIATDHAPHSLSEKTKNTWDSLSGIPALESTLNLLLTQVNNNRLTLQKLEQLVATNPAKIYGIPNKGQIKEGFDGDITVLDMNKTGIINRDEYYTKAKYTPFEKYEYEGGSILTIKGGNIISQNDEVFKTDCKYVY